MLVINMPAHARQSILHRNPDERSLLCSFSSPKPDSLADLPYTDLKDFVYNAVKCELSWATRIDPGALSFGHDLGRTAPITEVDVTTGTASPLRSKFLNIYTPHGYEGKYTNGGIQYTASITVRPADTYPNAGAISNKFASLPWAGHTFDTASRFSVGYLNANNYSTSYAHRLNLGSIKEVDFVYLRGGVSTANTRVWVNVHIYDTTTSKWVVYTYKSALDLRGGKQVALVLPKRFLTQDVMIFTTQQLGVYYASAHYSFLSHISAGTFEDSTTIEWGLIIKANPDKVVGATWQDQVLASMIDMENLVLIDKTDYRDLALGSLVPFDYRDITYGI